MRTPAAALLAVAVLAAPLASQTPAERHPWTRDAVCYEIFVRSFYDGDGDGIGDLPGLIRKLDYVNDGDPATDDDLGATCIWLMPVAESPSYHGYDVSDYYRVEPDYGTNEDFVRLVEEAHRRGIHVLVDMVLNHASSEHPFFQEALRDPRSPYRDWFRWSRTKPEEKGPWGQEVWHRSPVRDEYYYGVFWSGMPDLNYANPRVREEATRVARFWLEEMGVDGFRLDAVPYLVEEGDHLAHTAGTHQVLRDYARSLREIRPSAFTVGEVWDSVGEMLPYYPDQLDDYFAFEVSDRILQAVATGSAAGMLDPTLRLQRTLPLDRWAPFLRNHDQTRTLTALGGSLPRARLAATLLLTLPGLPFVYYGEEIGMTGDKPDERIRTPMQWTTGPHAGFTTGTPWEALQPDSATANVAAEAADPRSLLRHYRRLIHLRTGNAALSRGRVVPLSTGRDAVVAYLRRDGERSVLVVANLGDSAVASPRLASDPGAMPPGRYAARDLLGDRAAATLEVGPDGRVAGYVPVASLGPFESRVLGLDAR